jgi:hypothetical protein
MPALEELGIFFSVTFSTSFWFNGRLSQSRLVVVLMAGDAIHPLLSVFAVNPGQENPASILLMAGDAIAYLFFRVWGQSEAKNGKD